MLDSKQKESVDAIPVWPLDLDSDLSSSVGKLVPLNSIHVPQQQSRRYFDDSRMASLVQSVKEHGILEPLLVRVLGNEEYELVSGERRYRAAIAANLTEVPVIVKILNDADAMQVALSENLQREDLNPIEETEGILQLFALQNDLSVNDITSHLYRRYNELKGNASSSNHNVRVKQINARIDAVLISLGKMKWDSFVKNRLPLLNLPEEILQAIRSGALEYTKAKAISKIKDPEVRKPLVKRAVEEQLSLNEIRKLMRSSQPLSEQTKFEAKITKTVKHLQKAKICKDESTKEKLEELMAQIEALLSA